MNKSNNIIPSLLEIFLSLTENKNNRSEDINKVAKSIKLNVELLISPKREDEPSTNISAP